MSSDTLIKNYTWNEISNSSYAMNDVGLDVYTDDYNWIINGDERYRFLRSELVSRYFPLLRPSDKDLLIDGLVKMINLMRIKLGFGGNNNKPDSLLWTQLVQNNLFDLRALLGLMLPFIDDKPNDENKKKLVSLRDLYLVKDSRGNYVYTNSQYNRCIRNNEHGEIVVYNRPYMREYFDHHLELLLMSIETISHKLYVNWVDVVPIAMNEYQNSALYKNTVDKIIGPENRKISSINLINNYIDPNPGLSYQDIYNTMSNQLFHQIKNHKWLIYDIIVGTTPVPYINYLEERINFDAIWNNLLWPQLLESQRNNFINAWRKFMTSSDISDNTVLHHFYFFFSKYHKNAKRLIQLGQLILTRDIALEADEEDDAEENVNITPETTRNAKAGLANVPTEEIYLFFSDQLSAFKVSWYYYLVKIRGQRYLDKNDTIYITPKNIYNYAKSMVHYSPARGKFIPLPKYWCSLRPGQINLIMYRMLDIAHPIHNNWDRTNWFNINKYIRRMYPGIGERQLVRTNFDIHKLIRNKLVDIIFQSLIYHGLLSNFVPNRNITDSTIVRSNAGDNSEKQNIYKRSKMKEIYFTGNVRKNYEQNAYYFVTGTSYGQLPPLRQKEYPNFEKKYFDFLSENQIWTFTYAMNWVSQINFFHHYTNTRIMYVTGATGVGKSTQVPKLLMYSQKMLDYNLFGKIVCTQPRIEPTVTNADTISKEMGVPIVGYNSNYKTDVFTSNYHIQFKHKEKQHTDPTSDSFLKIVTDGTLYEEIINYPFMTKSVPDTNAVDTNGKQIEWAKIFRASNIYDIIIVDEAHEHNANMDMILSLARDAVYVNNSLKLVIVSATMEDDEPIYRRYYRSVNDNRAYPPNAFIEHKQLDRANMDRRIHISPPGETTQYKIIDHYLPKNESDLINTKNFVEKGIQKTIEVINSTTAYDLLLFMTGQDDINRAVKEINANTPANVICFGYYGALTEEQKTFIRKIHLTLPGYTRYKEDTNLDEKDVTRRVPPGTYNRAVIVATNVAEASITLQNLRYVVDTGYAKVNTYDPLDGISKLLTLPISRSSSQQRRGRVGRVAPGEVFYLYSEEKVINNKTAYKIADENIMDMLVKLIKADPNDSPIITVDNDINNLNILHHIREKAETGGAYDPDNLVYELLKNPMPYLAMIQTQYLYSPDLTDITQYYTYYGKDTFTDLDVNNFTASLNTYLIENHDDYHYQETQIFTSKGYTGFDDTILEDLALSFYIIHPDENIITRNMYTGKMIAIKYNESVSSSYYYYLLNINNIYGSIETIDPNKINFSTFILPKYYLAMDDAKLQLLVMDIPTEYTNPIILYKNVRDPIIRRYIQIFFDGILHENRDDSITTVKSNFLANLDKISMLAPVDVMYNTNNLLWYAYAIPHGIENDVLALMVMINTVPDIGQWIGDIKSRRDIEKFFMAHINEKGDIYFLWKLWEQIKELIVQNNMYAYTEIDSTFETKFRGLKNMYLSGKTIPLEEFELLEKMYKSGKLSTIDEFYNYIRQTSIDFKSFIEKSNAADMLNIIAKSNKLNPTHLQTFIAAYLESLFEINRGKWLRQYEIDNKINEKSEDIDVFEWAKQHLSLPGIPTNREYILDEWDHILETYLRAFSINLIKSESGHYLRINKGARIDPNYWSKRLILEKTFLRNKMEYLIYHSEQSISEKVSVTYLTPVKIEWILELNPIYYYYFLFDTSSIIKKMAGTNDPDVLRAIQLVHENKHLFNLNALIAYVDQINNPIYSNIIRKQIYNL